MEIKDEYVVYPNKWSSSSFKYGPEYRANEGMFRGEIPYGRLGSMIFRESKDLYGDGKAELLTGKGGRFPLGAFQKIYPRNVAHRR